MKTISIPIPLPLDSSEPLRTSSVTGLRLQQVIYARAFFPPAFSEPSHSEHPPRCIALTWETNGYLLWVMRQAVDAKGDKVWAEEVVTYLRPGGEDAIERAVALAHEYRGRYEALAAEAGGGDL